MHNVVVDNRSEPLFQALQSGNSYAAQFASLDIIGQVPTAQYTDGLYTAGHDGNHAPQRLLLLPYCEGPAGSQFSVRVYGWRSIGGPDRTAQREVVLPIFLSEFACTACNRGGPPPQMPTPFLKPTENLCDTISLTQGALGLTGEVVSTGPGTDLIAFALTELRGSRYFYFDFQQTDPVGMNCLFSRA